MINKRMESLVEISTIITESSNFFKIKDLIVEKMLEVVHPTKACINLFYKENYKHAYLVCSQTLDHISKIFPINAVRGVKVSIDTYPDYIKEAIDTQSIIYIEDVFKDIRAEKERDLAKVEGYIGRIVFPLTRENKVIGFMTCFLTEEDSIDDYDIAFISSVASLISLSIEITQKNNDEEMLVRKLRSALNSINEATKSLYINKDIDKFLEHISKQACHITNSQGCIILTKNPINNRFMNKNYQKKGNEINVEYNQINHAVILGEINEYSNDCHIKLNNKDEINSYICNKLDSEESNDYIICINATKYTDDDRNILNILAKQIEVGMKLYKYNAQQVKHKVLANELNILSKQQRLIMDKSRLEFGDNRELYYYHKAARVVGGDFYYAIKKDNGKIVYLIADVMGHGIVSNYVVAMIKGTFKTLCRQYETPAEIMTNLNYILFDEFDKMGVFTTCLIAVFDPKEENIIVSNAGHYSPIFVTKDKQIKRNINCVKGIPLGIIEDAEYINNEHKVDDCKKICMYTDGILEIKNKHKEEYGVSRLENFLINNIDKNEVELVDSLKKELKEFALTNNYDDDILIVILQEK